MNLKELQTEAHAIATAQGRWDPEPSFGELIAWVHGALSEAWQVSQTNGPWEYNGDEQFDSFAPELAELVIRVASIAQHYGVKLDEMPVVNWEMPKWVKSPGDWITALHSSISMIMLVASVTLYSDPTAQIPHGQDWPIELRDTIGRVHLMAIHYGIDLDAAISAWLECYKGSRREPNRRAS